MGGGVLAVIPVLTPRIADVCVDSLRAYGNASGLAPTDLLIVDNTRDGCAAARYPGIRTFRDPDGHNLGVARSWNVGAVEVLDRGLDYLIIMSAAMQFGPLLHTTWLAQMQEFWGAHMIEAQGHSWHLIAVHRSVFETIGFFDGNFYPGYFEAVDFSHRLQKIGLEGGWPRVWCNAMSQGVAMHLSALECPAGPLLDYMAAKWGGPKGEETFVLPFGDKPLDWWENIPIPELAARYGLGERGVGWW